MLIWYSQEARSYALLALFCALSLLYFVRALRRGRRRAATSSLWGVFSALALATHYFAVFPLAVEAVLLLRRRGRGALAGPLDRRPAGAAAGAAGDPPDVLRPRRVDRQVQPRPPALGNGGDLPHRRDRRHHRPARSGPRSPSCRWRWRSRPSPCWPCAASREERRAAAVPLARRPRPRSAIPLLLALASTEQGLRARPQPAAGAGPAAASSSRSALTPQRRAPARRRDRRRSCSPTRSASAIWVSSRPELQRPDWSAVAEHLGEPAGPRATVTWALGEAPLRYYLSTGAIQLKSVGRLRLAGARNRLRLRRPGAASAAPPARPRLPRNRPRRRRPPLHPPLPSRPARAWRRCGCGQLRKRRSLAQQRRPARTASDLD